jgi:benzylsuccinate CoA-transferase BbsE subunit
MGWKPLVDWMDSQGMAGDLKGDYYYKFYDRAQMGERMTAEESAHIQDLLRKFIRRFKTQEFYVQAQAKRIMACPASTARDLVESPQLRSREFFVRVEHPDLGERITYPGAPYKLGVTPWAIRRRAPRLGEDTQEVLSSVTKAAGGPARAKSSAARPSPKGRARRTS